jgi:hypothetical protein
MESCSWDTHTSVRSVKTIKTHTYPNARDIAPMTMIMTITSPANPRSNVSPHPG